MVKLVNFKGTDQLTNDCNQNGVCFGRDTSVQQILQNEHKQGEIIGFKYNRFKNYLTWCFYILSLGSLRLVFHWYPKLMLHATHSKCNLDVAEKVMIVDTYKSKYKTYFVKDVQIKSANSYSEQNNQNDTSNNSTRQKVSEKSDELTVHLEDGTTLQFPTLRIFTFKKNVYVWDPKKRRFTRMVGLDLGIQNSVFYSLTGMNEKEQNIKRVIYGKNQIEIPVQPILTLIALEVLTPFYIFQFFTVALWITEAYFYYSVAIVVMSIYGISSSVIQTRTNQKNLKGTVFTEEKITVLRRGGVFEEIKTSNLVPGDLIVIPSGGINMQCDAVLLRGNCVVNESMLTGESVPVRKTPLSNDNNFYRVKEDSNHTLFCGTTILQTKKFGDTSTLAVVIRTGYLTNKGELVRSILYPPPADFKFDQDTYKFLGILVVIAIMGLIYTVVTKSSRKLPFWEIVTKSLDLFTIAIPPALPAAMTVGKLYALGRLKKKNIYCINSRVINVSGSVDCVCFDKTGTLTEDELDLWGVLPVTRRNFSDSVRDISTMTIDSPLYKGMLTCHSLSNIDGKLCGYPLDLKIFSSTNWCYKEPSREFNDEINPLPLAVIYPGESCGNDFNCEIGVYGQFPFISALQRSSVICRDMSEVSRFEVYCKGSPEIIAALSRPETVPEDLFGKLNTFTTKGYRVIAMGTRVLENFEGDLGKITREQVEKDLSFIGLIVMENRLKPQTSSAIKVMKDAGLKITMITGDNIQTAVSVGLECGIVDRNASIIEVIATQNTKEGHKIRYQPFSTNTASRINTDETIVATKCQDIEWACDKYQFVLTGKSWSNIVDYFPSSIPNIVTRGVVFSRMSAPQKQQVIESLKNLGYYVAMCGDGANDCAALKAAHLGISLSEAEASIAAPFTSKESNVTCVPLIIREGRAALVTSFGVFKYMVCGSLAEFSCVVVLYGIDCNLSSMEFLVLDLVLQLTLVSFFGNTKPSEKLHNKPQLTSILSFVPILSMLLIVTQNVALQILAFYYVRSFPWYSKFIHHHDDGGASLCHENYPTFVLTMFQAISMAFLFSKSQPHRKAIYTNTKLTTVLVLTTLFCTFVTLDPPGWLAKLLEMNLPPEYGIRYHLLILALINFTLAFFIEELLIDVILDKKLYPWFKRHRKSMKSKDGLNICDQGKTDIRVVDECSNGFRKDESLVNNGVNDRITKF